MRIKDFARRALLVWGACALLAVIPNAIWQQQPAPWWYRLLQALALSVPGLVVGCIALLAGRDRTDGGLKPALITAAVFTGVQWFAVLR